jgi:hypothetical protein
VAVNIGDLVQADLRNHVQKRTDYYGRPLMSGTGTDNLRELYEQLMDACIYVRAAIEERDQS